MYPAPSTAGKSPNVTSRNAGNSTEERALHLLGQGIAPETVAAACGVSVSRISQLLSTEDFIAKVSELRFQNLEKHNITDGKYDDLESHLLDRLKDCLPLMGMDPMKLLKAVQVINAAKRRGVSAPEQVTQQQTVVSLIMPNVIVQKFTTNIHNQVVSAGEQSLATLPSSLLSNLVANNSSSILNLGTSPNAVDTSNKPTSSPNNLEVIDYVNTNFTAP